MLYYIVLKEIIKENIYPFIWLYKKVYSYISSSSSVEGGVGGNGNSPAPW